MGNEACNKTLTPFSNKTPVAIIGRHRGFTLLELIVVVAITAIMVTIGIPSFLDNIRNNRLTTQANTFVGVLNLARSEAIKHGVRVTLRRSTNGSSCNTESAKDSQWESG